MALFLKKFILNLLFPVICVGCRRETPNSAYLCARCFKKLKFYGKTTGLNLKFVDELNVAGDYDNRPLAGLIKLLKFNAVPEAGTALVAWLTLFWQGPAALKPPNLLVIPIPLAARRRQRRGFNQAEIIARGLANNFDYEISLELIKIKNTRAQSGLNAKGRSSNLTGAFKWQGPRPIKRDILLIDDIATTGATLEAAAETLKLAGAQKIIALVAAKG
ncbi:MAG: ComF family protein [Candidatus Falkowbacteria bacterium]|nr:MAG: ComF family protein [Candidatus Falkowbacteria bacterium]